jgi:hypothetical protein
MRLPTKLKLGPDFTTLLKIAAPERFKYLRTSALAGVHAGIFMYLPQVFKDITRLMDKSFIPSPLT